MAAAGAFPGKHSVAFYCPTGTDGLQYLVENGFAVAASTSGTSGNDMYVLSRAGAALTSLGHHCVQMGSITSFVRKTETLDELTTFELFLTLQQRGWIHEHTPTKSKCAPFGMGADKVFYVHLSMSRPYFLALLNHEKLLSACEGFSKIDHLQSKAYYEAILTLWKIAPFALSGVLPNQPAAFYKRLTSECHSRTSGKRKREHHMVEDDFEYESGYSCLPQCGGCMLLCGGWYAI